MNSFSNNAYPITAFSLWKIGFTAFVMVPLLLSGRCSYANAQVSPFQRSFCSFVQNFVHAKKNNICTSTFIYVRNTVEKMTKNTIEQLSFILLRILLFHRSWIGIHSFYFKTFTACNEKECKCEHERTAEVWLHRKSPHLPWLHCSVLSTVILMKIFYKNKEYLLKLRTIYLWWWIDYVDCIWFHLYTYCNKVVHAHTHT